MFTNDIEIKINQYRISGIDISDDVDIQSRLQDDIREEVPFNLISAATHRVYMDSGSILTE